MKQPDDFDQIGKKVPYRVPEGFFEAMQQQVLSRVEAQQPRRSPRRLYLRVASAVIGAAAVVCALVFLPQSYPDVSPSGLVANGTAVSGSWIEQLADDELQEMDDFSDYDVFMINE